MVSHIKYSEYPTGDADEETDKKLTSSGYTLTKFIGYKTKADQLDGFKLIWSPDAGGADVTMLYGYFCASSI
jgi:hypothetical protein